MRPYVVKEILDSKNRVVKSFRPEPVNRIISQETSLEVTRILKQVVEPGGTGTAAALPGYEVAGKTGTAQKVDPLLKTYTEDRYVSSFMGFVPADNPKLAILVVIDEPGGIPYGGVVAAPVFRTIAQETLPYLDVAPKNSVAQLEKRSEQAQRPNKPEAQPRSDEQPEGVMPDLSGLSMKAALKWLGGMKLEIQITGRGILREQMPRPGTKLKEGTICILSFAPPS